MRSAAAIALMVTAVGGAWRYAPMLRDVMSGIASRSASATAAIAAAPLGVEMGAPTRTDVVPVSASIPTASAADSVMAAAMTAAAGAGDSITWVPAVARTWVNVRSDASRGGEVVGVIKPASRAMLGTDRAGWRQVRSPDVSGWVDPRLFEPDSLRTRGE